MVVEPIAAVKRRRGGQGTSQSRGRMGIGREIRRKPLEKQDELMTNSLNRLQILVAAGLALGSVTVLGATLPATSAPSFDGVWSVVIVTEKGTCDRAYRYPIRISNGAVLNEGSSPATISGK